MSRWNCSPFSHARVFGDGIHLTASDMATVQNTDVEKQAAYLAALLLPLRDITVPLKKGKTEPAASHVIGKSLKWPNAVVNAVTLMHTELPSLAHIADRVQGVLQCPWAIVLCGVCDVAMS